MSAPDFTMDPVPEKTVFVPRTAAHTDLFQTGDIVGQYCVEKVLGQGGMGVVYLVKHIALKKNFALKALPAKLAEEASFVRRFKKEAQTLGTMKHGHIVNVTDFGENQGRLYLVLEYVDGGSLDDWFTAHAKPGSGAPGAEVGRILEQILLGLAHAHEAGFIHRDLKPANILMEKTGEAKISDFGLARAVAEEQYRREGGTASPFQGDSVTTTGSIVGTIDFMSPEARNMRESDARSDIYAIGVITYYLLTGRRPHGMAELPSRLVAGLDPRWDKFVGICLAEDPANRYANAGAALEGLKQLLQPAKSKSWKLPVSLLVAAGVAVGLWLSLRPAPPPAGPAAGLRPAVAAESSTVKVELPKPAGEVPPRKFVVTGLPPGTVVNYHERNHSAGAAGRVVLELPPGPQFVRVVAPGFLEWEGEIGAAANETEAKIPLEKVPPHAVRFTGLPAQAQITVGDQTAKADANGEAIVELRPGRVGLTASAPKYSDLEVPLDIQQTTQSVPLEMKRLPPPAEVVVKLAEGNELKFRWLPPGSFFAGSPPDERGRQRTDLPRAKADIPKGLYMAVTEMTQRQHRALTGRNPSSSRALGDETRPVEQIAWRDLTESGGVLDKCNEALRRLKLPFKADLPTEVEWEYACRAGTDSGFNDGSNLTNERDDPALNKLAYYTRGGSRDAPSPVAKFKPNNWGLYDMLGNVAEWAYGVRGEREPVVRGGNWKVGPMHCRAASRIELTTDTRSNDTMGYRLVLRPLED